MKITLFDHNQAAYDAATDMLQQTGKAAIIHPTGTGKSFIAFRLCADHPDKRILWLSPSEYIFKTQLENLKAAAGDEELNNITFCTYAKLMLMEDAEIAGICGSGAENAPSAPDYIILDEFHRCGAKCWGQGVQRLLAAFPETPILGLSATNIRYLDNQRDMADELFDGNVASQMSLGEAIVRGILNPPKYVLSVYSWKKDLVKYEKRISQCRSKLVRDECDRYLEELRRTLEMADGLDVIFDKHMSNRTGKYIVFCSGKEHMDEMLEHLDWFAKVDPHPHVYSLYSSDPGAGREFDSFRNDNDNTHLRLLYCIDALNEGIHVEGISGVILLRPTVSPTVYKQQIGRALSASGEAASDITGTCRMESSDTAGGGSDEVSGCTETGSEKTSNFTVIGSAEASGIIRAARKEPAVIFDIVSNIEALWSIDSVEEEMQLVTSYYRSLGEDERIVNEHFQIIDELQDCRRLFAKLNDTLTASWDLMFAQAKAFYEENGNLEVPCRYITADGYALGNWIANQRRIRKGQLSGALSEERIRRLDSIGMVWEAAGDLKWERYYAAAKRYREKYGDLNAPAKYVDEEGVALGAWLSDIRALKNAGGHQMSLSPERIQKLNDLGMTWDMLDYFWERNYTAAASYYREHRDLNVPAGYVTEEGIRLGTWVYRLRALRAGTAKGTPPTEEQVRRLDAIGMVWKDLNEDKWEKGLQAAAAYQKEHGTLQVPASYVADNGCKLRVWLQRQRSLLKKGKLSEERIQRLNTISSSWQADAWESKLALVKAWYQEKGTLYIPRDTVVDGVWLGAWLKRQKQSLEAGKLTAEQAALLSELPLEQLSVPQEDKNWKIWLQMYQDAEAYVKEHGSLRNIPHSYRGESGGVLCVWVSRQRLAKKNGHLSEKQIQMLEEIGA
ncbi:MAG: Helicase associated domain protein [Lachnospiraceae bacterium]|nr:Helicase associated domain protein [Lachnospiraceae bacterium]